jgi:hypothetical protein
MLDCTHPLPGLGPRRHPCSLRWREGVFPHPLPWYAPLPWKTSVCASTACLGLGVRPSCRLEGRWVNAGGWKALVSSVLSMLPLFAMTALKLPPKFLDNFDRIRRNFLWDIEDEQVASGKCKIRWDKVCSPTEIGGLGWRNLALFGRALRLRWIWFEWSLPPRTWARMQTPCDAHEHALFHSITRVTVGDGVRALFWRST